MPSSPPPAYENSGPPNPAALSSASEKAPLGSNNPYNPARTGDSPSTEDDARLAAQLQAEEDARAGVATNPAKGAASNYYTEPSQPQLGPRPSSQGTPANSQTATPEPRQQSRSRGFLSKLMGKHSSSSSSSGYTRPPAPAPRPPPQPYAYQQGGYYGGYPPQQPMGYGYGYPPYAPQSGYYPGMQRRNNGMGTAGAAALGVGGGLLGGALLAGAMDDWGDHDGGGFGGDDMGGGDFGGDF